MIKKILILGIAIRLLIFGMGIYIDKKTSLTYTDVDYDVLLDGAKYVLNGGSPFERYTYRYTPLLAYLAIPSIVLNEHLGKVIFIIFDLLCALILLKICSNFTPKNKIYALCFYFLNPNMINCSTRGSFESVLTLSLFLTILTYKNYPNLSAFFYGLSVHLKIFPIIFCLTIYLNLQGKNNFFNRKSIQYGIISASVLLFFTLLFYKIYGFTFLYKGYLYHLIRKDHRHNFSIQFMQIYLDFMKIDKF